MSKMNEIDQGIREICEACASKKCDGCTIAIRINGILTEIDGKTKQIIPQVDYFYRRR